MSVIYEKKTKMSTLSEYTIGGVKIMFPCKAYPSQLSMMNAIIKGLNNGQHCLLESPTGSGKTLALLCSALAWQRTLREKRGECEKEAKGTETPKACQCGCHCWTTTHTSGETNPDMSYAQTSASKLFPKKQAFVFSGDDDDDFQTERKRVRVLGAEQQSKKRPCLGRGVHFINEDLDIDLGATEQQQRKEEEMCHSETFIPLVPKTPPGPCSLCFCGSNSGKDGDQTLKKENEEKPIPKIYFGTRTHKQIAQITKELRRSAYSNVPMTILSSRDFTCIHPSITSNKNEKCKELLEAKDGRSCRFYHGFHKIREESSCLNQAWDIEELVGLGRRLKACPYYAARDLMQDAYIIFCPYNYLLDKQIRGSMNINLKDQVVILDEAHNIEDCSRESASFTVTEEQLMSARDEIDNMIQHNIRCENHEPLCGVCYSLTKWIRESSELLVERAYESSSKVWEGKDILTILHGMGITNASFPILQNHLAAVIEKEEKLAWRHGGELIIQLPTVSPQTQFMLKGLFMVFTYLFKENSRYANDYRVALQQTYTWTNRKEILDENGFFARPKIRKNIRQKTAVLVLNFWCLNPAVAFSEVSGNARSIVLTSGTLSPMESFSSELGVKFCIQLEANHVINKSQVWVGTIGTGPKGRKLCATFQYTETFEFQDEVGELLLSICHTVSHGVLCFMSSYKMLDKLKDRWMHTGLWEMLESIKMVVVEPQGGDKTDFDKLLQLYYNGVRNKGEKDGALLIAVCRGKVSEGLDFSDDNARAVLTIGIPFPNVKDLQVELKRKYNDQHTKIRGLLSGSQWYEIQAYRALNQALGRCIRHKNDWGALILVDDRFRSNPNKYIAGLSKWVRQQVRHHITFSEALQSLDGFAKSHQESTDSVLHYNGDSLHELSSLRDLSSTSSILESTIHPTPDDLPNAPVECEIVQETPSTQSSAVPTTFSSTCSQSQITRPNSKDGQKIGKEIISHPRSSAIKGSTTNYQKKKGNNLANCSSIENYLIHTPRTSTPLSTKEKQSAISTSNRKQDYSITEIPYADGCQESTLTSQTVNALQEPVIDLTIEMDRAVEHSEATLEKRTFLCTHEVTEEVIDLTSVREKADMLIMGEDKTKDETIYFTPELYDDDSENGLDSETEKNEPVFQNVTGKEWAMDDDDGFGVYVSSEDLAEACSINVTHSDKELETCNAHVNARKDKLVICDEIQRGLGSHNGSDSNEQDQTQLQKKETTKKLSLSRSKHKGLKVQRVYKRRGTKKDSNKENDINIGDRENLQLASL
uniref:DNA 5'-3' helicase n=1 Tax=Geotrypetes seraphini TaxID=260995 RepID=A0A6P8PTE0_GEOSA|nr:Fanconi anemia group J protein isoform X3 [Geotrypetes seraphini]